MNQQQFIQAIIEYVHKLPELCRAYTPSLFWERHVQVFDENIAKKDLAHITLDDVWELTKKFPQEPPVYFGFTTRPQNIFLKKLQYRLHRNSIYTLSKDSIENIAALLFLEKKGLLSEYESLRMKLGVTSSMTFARHFYYVTFFEHHIKKVFGSIKPLRVLEIGGGGGMLARILFERGLIKTYYDVDLPEILLSASLTLSRSVPDATFRFCGGNVLGKTATETAFNFYPAQYFNEVPRGHFDLILNVASFQEMDNSVRDMYVRSAKDLAAKPTLFININRKQDLPQRDGTTVLTNPLTYPYDSGEEILDWGADQMQDTIRANTSNSLFRLTPKSFPIVRVSLIK